MAYYYFPSCKATAQFKEASKTAREYVNQKFGVKPIGSCRPNHNKLTAEDTAIVVCNNCAAIPFSVHDRNCPHCGSRIEKK